MKKIRKAIFPVAGLGTRFLPATKAIPKEMLAVADKPLIQYAVDEAREAGIEEFIFVTGRGKGAIEDHFDHDRLLEDTLKSRQKTDMLKIVKSITKPNDRFFFTRQPEALGLGHAIWCAKHLIGDEPFAILSPDDIVFAQKGCLAQMMDIYNQYGGNVVAIQDIPKKMTGSYGVIDPMDSIPEKNLVKVKGLVEKPKPEDAPSTLSIIGRYILQPDVFKHLDKKQLGHGGEIQLTDAMIPLINDHPFFGYQFDGTRYDCGSKIGFLQANIAYALTHDDIKDELVQFMIEQIKDNEKKVKIG